MALASAATASCRPGSAATSPTRDRPRASQPAPSTATVTWCSAPTHLGSRQVRCSGRRICIPTGHPVAGVPLAGCAVRALPSAAYGFKPPRAGCEPAAAGQSASWPTSSQAASRPQAQWYTARPAGTRHGTWWQACHPQFADGLPFTQLPCFDNVLVPHFQLSQTAPQLHGPPAPVF